MKVDFPQDRAFALWLGAITLLAAVTVGGAAAGIQGILAGGVLGFGGAAGLTHLMGRRQARRRQAIRRRFPEDWRDFLERSCDLYARLPPSFRVRFEEDLKIFLAEKRITGVGVEVTDELRLLVAASAVTLSLGWPDFEWDRLTEVLLYRKNFGRDYGTDTDELAGQAHHWGTVILSVPELEVSFDEPERPYHVGIHEFAHLLELSAAGFGVIPVGMPDAPAAQWEELVTREMERLRRGKSAFDEYGVENPVEFLAVAVEAFFQIPQEVRRRHREVYAILSAYFNQDPAAWDDERGLPA